VKTVFIVRSVRKIEPKDVDARRYQLVERWIRVRLGPAVVPREAAPHQRARIGLSSLSENMFSVSDPFAQQL
jgi:hypothetical protein